MSLKTLVQLNGTSAEDLIEARMDLLADIQSAIRRLAKTAPNARDYQHDRTGIALTIATNGYLLRAATLEKINKELTEEIEDLDAQRTARAAARGGK